MLREVGSNFGIIFITLVILVGGFCLIGVLLKGERFTMYQAASGKTIQVKRGFSFTYLFFGSFVPLFRGHIAGFFLTFFLNLFTCGIAHWVMVFCYNGMYINWLANSGYTRMDNEKEPEVSANEKVPKLPWLKRTVIDDEDVQVQDDEPTAALKQGAVVGVSGMYKDASIKMEYGNSIAIGRDEKQCNLILTGKEISRKHCDISYDAFEGIYLVNDYSTNGVFLENGERLANGQLVKLPVGSKIRMGDGEDVFLLS
ncbi:MAG: FHA domain-containing protein [Lachnospiraceae bacterium]